MDANRHAHHEGAIQLVRTDGVKLDNRIGGQNGAAAYWQDGSTSYLLHTRTEHELGYTIADEADTAIQFVDRIALGEDIPAASLAQALRDIRALRKRLEAAENEAILYAREYGRIEPGQRPRPRMTTQAVAEALQIDASTVTTRHQHMTAGKHAEWRRWLVQGTERAALYNKAAG